MMAKARGVDAGKTAGSERREYSRGASEANKLGRKLC